MEHVILHGADAGLVLCCADLEPLGQRPQGPIQIWLFLYRLGKALGSL